MRRSLTPRLWRFWMAGRGMSRQTAAMLALSAATGIAAGLAAAGFEWLIGFFRSTLMDGAGGTYLI